MKQIKVSEELFEYLKKEAEANFRPIGKQIEFYLFGDPRQPIKTTPARNKTPQTKVEPEVVTIEGTGDGWEVKEPVKPKFKLTGKLCKEHKVDVDICKNMKH